MTDHANAALARKLSAGQENVGNTPRSILRALRLALARSAGERLNLPLSVIGVKQVIRAQEDLASVIAEGWLLLQFTSDGGAAAVCIDPGCVSAIVQTQTIGEVLGGQPQPRAFTDTDAAMAVPLIDDLFQRIQTLVDAPRDIACLSGYEFAMRAESPRALGLVMVNDSYRVFDLTVDLAGGVRQGQISILLPDAPEVEEEQAAASMESGLNLGQASGVIRAELHAMICRMSLPLSAFSDLKPGDVLPLTGARLDRTDVQTIDRTRAAIGRLGQCGGMRAIRINEQASPLALSEGADQVFLESRTLQPDTKDLRAASLPDTEADLPQTQLSSELTIDEDLTFTDSDQMVAQISQLAGLPDHDGGTDPAL